MLKPNQQALSGVLHQEYSAQHYQLRRYLPISELESVVEQFWLVDWDLSGKAPHVQQNLPDPNMHLVFDASGCRVMAPVSKKYSYVMENKGSVIGVKFNIGLLAQQLPKPIEQAVDQTFILEEVFQNHTSLVDCKGFDLLNDQAILAHLNAFLLAQNLVVTTSMLKVHSLIETIKSQQGITKVEQLAEQTHTSVRNIQRLFKNYVGLSPKWLIRKYRLHQALALLDDKQVNLTEVAAQLDYADQSHLIRDFKDFLNVTPSQYR